MSHTWQLQDAESKLNRVIEEALKHGPQVITEHGVETAVVLSIADYKKMLIGRKKLSDFFQESPLVGLDIDLIRETNSLRDVSNLR